MIQAGPDCHHFSVIQDGLDCLSLSLIQDGPDGLNDDGGQIKHAIHVEHVQG